MRERRMRLQAWVQQHWKVIAAGGAGVVAVVVVAVAAIVLLGGGGEDGGSVVNRPPLEDLAVAISPEGDEVPRLSPVIVRFEEEPAEQDGAALLQIEPAAEGDFAWLDERTLLFQPAYPGFQRGISYRVRVDGAAAGIEEDHEQSFTVAGKLVVANVIPADDDAEVPLEAQILVQFSRSVAPLTTLDARDDSPVIEFDPPLAGTGEWLNTSLYRFVPDDLQPSTSYEAKIAAGLTSAADGVLEEDFVWSFATVQPALAGSDPSDNTQFVGINRPVALTFNQPMDRASVEAAVELRDPDGEAVPGTFAWSDSDRVATFTPASPLELSSQYEVIVPEGVQGAVGGETRAQAMVAFTTSDPPRVERSDPSQGSTDAARWGFSLGFNNPMDTDSVEERLTISSFDHEDLIFEWYEDRELYVGLPLDPSTDYVVRIADGATDRDGLKLGPFELDFHTGQLPPTVTFAVPGQLATYSAASEPVLYFHSTNTPSISFELYRLSEDEAAQVLERGYIPGAPGDSHWTPSSSPIRRWTHEVQGEGNTVVLDSTSLSGDGEPLPLGDYYVIATEGPTYSTELMFSVVNAAIVTKLSFDELLVWALDYETGEPLANVTVAVGGPGPVVGSAVGRTNLDGLVSFEVPSPPEVVDVERAYVVRLDEGSRRGIASTRWQNGSEPWLLNLPYGFWPTDYVAHLYGDRPIYRPGETVYFKGVVRADDDATYHVPEVGSTFSLVIRDPQYDELAEIEVTTNEFGTFAAQLELPEGASTGGYNVDLVEPRGTSDYWITSTYFTVAEFRTPEFEVSVEAGRDDYIDGETIDATATASFYFGGALAGADVQWTALSSPTFFSVEGFEEYSFSDFDVFREVEFLDPLRASGETTTDVRGEADFSVDAVIRGNEGTQRYELSATVIDQNSQAIASNTSVTVHPAAYYAGINPDAYIATAGEAATVNLVSVDTQGELAPDREIVVEVYDREWVTTKEETADGARRYVSEPRDTLLETLAATTGDDGEASVSFTPQSSGSLRLVATITDEQGRVARSATYLWVSGGGFASWRVRNDDVIELIADREEYEVGDVAEVLVPAPFAGATALVTIERGKIIERSTRTFEGNSEVLRIPIEDSYLPNVYVGVVLYRPPTADDPLPRYNVGYVELPVSTAPRVLDVTVKPESDRAAPGDTVRYQIHVTNSEGQGTRAEVSLAIVDKAVLSLADEVGPDGLHAFWYQRGLGVATSSSLAVSIDRTNDVISSPDFGGKGGGAERLRQDFRNTAYWDPQIETDADGFATVDVTMPDNLTTWRAQARAVSGDTKVGEGTSELLVTQPLLIRPALPRFLRVGDAATLRVLVTNGSGAAEDVEITLDAEGLEIDGPLTLSQRIASDGTATFEWPARALAEGMASFTFRASGGDYSDAVAVELPVLLDVTPETTATGGVVEGETGVEAIYLPDFAIQEGGSLEVSVQGSIVGGLEDELPKLRPLPYESTERVASRLIATLAVDHSRGAAPSNAQVQADIAQLVSDQHGDGGWGWCRQCQTDVDMTAWVLLALGDAAQDGYTVDENVVGRARSVIRSEVTRTTDVERPANQDDRAFLLYALASVDADVYKGENASLMRAIFEQHRADLGNWGRAALLLGLREVDVDADSEEERALLNDLTAATIASANGNHWEDPRVPGSFRNNTRITALVLEALVTVDPDHPLIEETARWLVVARTARGWETTPEIAQAASALGAFATSTGELGGDFDYEVRARDETVLEGHFTPSSAGDLDATELPLTDFPLGEVSLVSFLREAGAAGRLYYGLNLRYLTPATEVEALNRGFAVSHEYSLLDTPEQTIDAAPLSEVVRVTLTIVAPADRKFVVLEDFLPAGLEPIDPQLRIVPIELKQQLQEERTAAILGDAPEYFAPWFAWYYNPWDHVDVRDDRVTLFAAELPAGVHEYVYFARATSPGDYFVAPPHIEETYFPEVFGRGDSTRFEVTD